MAEVSQPSEGATEKPKLPFAATLVRRAQRPRAPQPSPATLQAQEERETYLRTRWVSEQRSVLRGLALLALLALGISLARAGADRAFYAGWWRQW